MHDLDRILRRLDEIEPTDVWPSVADHTRSEPVTHPGASVAKRTAAALVALSVSLLAGVFLWRAFLSEPQSARPARPEAPWAMYSSGWSELPDPDRHMPGSAWVWTGSELVTWGGTTGTDPARASTSGERFDPATGVWLPLPEAPEGRTDTHVVWTGREILFWGGWDEGKRIDGLAFDPATNRWRSIPPAPLAPGRVAVVLWAGREMIVWGGGQPGLDQSRQGAAYDPISDSWRSLSPAPLGLNLADAVWTGREMIAFGSLLDGRNIAETKSAVGARYEPVTDRWSVLPPSDLSPQATAVGLVDGEMIAYDYLVRTQSYDPVRDRWSDRRKLPLEPSECYPDAAVVERVFFAFFCGQAAIFDGGRQEWSRVGGGMVDETDEADGGTYALYRFATLVPVDAGIVFAAQGVTVDDSGELCYGCPGTPTSVWLWRP